MTQTYKTSEEILEWLYDALRETYIDFEMLSKVRVSYREPVERLLCERRDLLHNAIAFVDPTANYDIRNRKARAP